MNMKTTNEMFNKMKKEKKLSESSVKLYERSIRFFEKETGLTIPKLINIHEKERRDGVFWRDCTLKEKLIDYRDFLYDKDYKQNTIENYYSCIIALLNYYEIELGKIYTIKKETDDLKLIDELITREEIQQCVNSTDTPIIKALTFFLISTGLAPVDALKLTIKDYLKITSEYHNYNLHNDIRTAIMEMQDKEVIPVITGHRTKNKKQYITFATPEAIKATNIYLISREETLKLDSPLFNMSKPNLMKIHRKINKQLNLGVTKEGYARFSMKYMRSYHDTQLSRAGMNDATINILSGRKNDTVIRKHYITIDINELKQEYIKCLPYLLIEDINKVKSELDNVIEEKKELEQENKDLKTNINNIYDRLNNLENRQRVWEQVKESQKK